MGLCRGCLQASAALLVALAAVLVFFHLECVKERDREEQERLDQVFQPEVTDVVDVPLGFCRQGHDTTMSFGLEYILNQVAPCALTKLISHLGKKDYGKPDETHNVTIYDARKTQFGGFHETGFTLIEVEDEIETTDWRTNGMTNEDADIKKFHKQMEPHLRALYPETKRIQWTSNVVRGGGQLGDQPKAVGGPHLDYHQNNSERILFHEEYPNPTLDQGYPDFESDLLMGSKDDSDSSLRVLLGLWKPLIPVVCDHPLAVMDATTFLPENLQKNFLHINFGIFTFHNLNGAISYSPGQRWAYYSFQTIREVLVFHQFSRDRWMANPHTSLLNRNCPPGSQSRVSVEMRVALYF